ncbi:MAG: O-antigen ligase family protein, partial [Proteobacteria bacterium]|nr:O-antigen ligase family protein [Pseudomonadota bacterium]
VRYYIDLKFFYLIIIVNSMILLAFYNIKINRDHIFILSLLFMSGLWGLLRETTSFYNFFAQFIGISIISLYYYAFFKVQKINAETIFKIYAKASFYVCIYGFFDFIYGRIILGNDWYRLKSVMMEPAHFATLVMPAFYYYLVRTIENKRINVYLVIILTAIVLSNSSVGYIGILCSFFLVIKKINIRSAFIVFTTILVFFLLFYNLSPEFKMRLDDSVSAFKVYELKGENISTFALFSNLFIAKTSLSNDPFLGGGLGSHVVSYFNNIHFLPGLRSSTEYISKIGLNARDANSLLIRILSELGILGFLFTMIFIFKFFIKKDIISRAIVVYFILKLLREGHYFSPEMYFFVMLYYFNYKQKITTMAIDLI